MGMRTGAPPEGVRGHMVRYGTEPLRKANRSLAIKTNGWVTLPRIACAMILALLLGVYAICSKSEKSTSPEQVSAAEVFNREVGPKELECAIVREMLRDPEVACSEAITAFLQKDPPAAGEGPKPPATIILRGHWGGFGGLTHEQNAAGGHRLSGRIEQRFPAVGDWEYGGMGADNLLLAPPANGTLRFTTTNHGAPLQLRVDVNGEKGDWVSVGRGKDQVVEVPLTEGMLKQADGMLDRVTVLLKADRDAWVEVSLSALTIEGED